MAFITELYRLTRFEHGLMLAAAVLIAETVVLGHLPPAGFAIALSVLVPIFSEMGAFALNDYLDVETDRLNRKSERPLVKGTLQPRFSLYFSVSCLLLSVLLAFPINAGAFLIALAFGLLAVSYNLWLKDLPLIGNAYIALTMAIPFLFGNFVVSGNLSPVVVLLAALGFVAGLAREIVKSAQDMEGDITARGSKTVPVVIGKKASLALAAMLYVLFIPLSAAPFVVGLHFGILAGILIAAADLLVLAIVFRILTSPERSYGFARNASLAAFALGLAGVLAAAL